MYHTINSSIQKFSFCMAVISNYYSHQAKNFHWQYIHAWCAHKAGHFCVASCYKLELGFSVEMASWRVALEVLLLAVLLSCSFTHSSGDFFSRLLSNEGENLMNLARSLKNCIYINFFLLLISVLRYSNKYHGYR